MEGTSLRHRIDEIDRSTVLIGVALGVLSAGAVPAILLAGYFLRVLRAGACGTSQPVFEDWWELGKEGVMGFLIVFCYIMIVGVPVFIAGAAAGGRNEAAASGAAAAATTAEVLHIGSLVVAAGAGLLGLYLLPAALTNYALRGESDAAFAFDELQTIVTTKQYVTNWAASVVLVGGLGIVGAGAAGVSLPNPAILTAAIPPFDIAVTILLFSAVSGVVTFFVGVIVASLIGRACAGFPPKQRDGDLGNNQSAA